MILYKNYICCNGEYTAAGYVHERDCTLHPGTKQTLTITDSTPILVPYVHVCCEHVNQWEARWKRLKAMLKNRIAEHNDSVEYHRKTGNKLVADIQAGCATVMTEILIRMEKLER